MSMRPKDTTISDRVRVVGAGLAGSEAAWQLAQRGYQVELIEMRPKVMTEAHQTGLPAELVCSNSFRGNAINQAPGVLKRELRLAKSMIMDAGDAAQVPAGGAFAVDREQLSEQVQQRLNQCSNIDYKPQLCSQIDDDIPTIIATGPLTENSLAQWLRDITDADSLAFYDAIAPIILRESIDETQGFWGNRRDEDTHDYFNIPLDKEQYNAFVEAVRAAERVAPNKTEENLVHFEGCLPIEVMADRGIETLRYGPLKGVGLTDPRTDRWPYAAVQLRKENSRASMMNMVGFQTKMKYGAQLEVLRSLPCLGEAEFVRMGSLHRNTFMNSPKLLTQDLSLRARPNIWIAGQLSGVEGYIESTASGLIAALMVDARLSGTQLPLPPQDTAIGALLRYITDPEVDQFQPMNTNFGLFSPLPGDELPKRKVRGRARKAALGERAVESFATWIGTHNVVS